MGSLIAEGQDPRDYQFRAEMSSPGFVRSGPYATSFVQAKLTQEIKFGKNGYYVHVVMRQWIDAGSSTLNWEAILTIGGLWATSETRSGTGVRAVPWKSRIEIDDLALQVTGSTCNTFAIQATELRWYIDDVLEHTETADVALTDIVPYDPRENRMYCKASGNPNSLPSFSNWPDCGPGITAGERTTDVNGTFGWRWAPAGTTTWVYDEVDIVNRSIPSAVPPPGCTCDCDEPVLSITVTDSTQQSWSIFLDSYYSDEQIVTTHGSITCQCSGPGSCGSDDLDLYGTQRIYLEQTPQLWAFPKYGPIVAHSYKECAKCVCELQEGGTPPSCCEGVDADCTCTTLVQDQAYTTCKLYSEVLSANVRFYCGVITREGCGGPSCDYDFADCTGLIARKCFYRACRVVDWPTDPDCGEGLGDPSYDVGQASGHWRSLVSNDSKLILGKSSNVPVSWADTTLSTEVYWARVIQARTRKDAELFILYRDKSSGDVKLAKSSDAGATITAVVTIAAGTQGSVAWTPSGLVFCYYLDGTTIKCKVYDSQLTEVRTFSTNLASVSDNPFDVTDSVAGQGVFRMSLVYFTSGGLVRTLVHSSDGETFS